MKKGRAIKLGVLSVVFLLAAWRFWNGQDYVDSVLLQVLNSAKIDSSLEIASSLWSLSHVDSVDKGQGDGLSFYILAPPNITTNLLLPNLTKKASEIYGKNLNEESAELWLHRGFERLLPGARTLNPAKADVILIAGYLHLHWRLQQKRGGLDDSLIRDILSRISHPSKPHILLVPSWNFEVSRKIGIKSLNDKLIQHEVNLWSVGFERNPMWQHVPPERILPIPYVLNESRDNVMNTFVANRTRSVNSIFYVGDERPNARGWAGCDRRKLLQTLEEGHNNTSSNSFVRLVNKRNRISQSEYNEKMSKSEYCLILCGDTPSSRSLTSAMALGCLPVRVGSRLRGLCERPCHKGFGWKPTGAENPHLPFPETIGWDRFPELNESTFLVSGYEVLQDMFREFDDSRKIELHDTVRKVQNGWIYGWGDPVTSADFGEAVPYIWKSFQAMIGLQNGY